MKTLIKIPLISTKSEKGRRSDESLKSNPWRYIEKKNQKYCDSGRRQSPEKIKGKKQSREERVGKCTFFTLSPITRWLDYKFWSTAPSRWGSEKKKEEKKESKQKEGEEGDDDECEKRGKELKIKTFHLPNIFLLSTWFLFF